MTELQKIAEALKKSFQQYHEGKGRIKGVKLFFFFFENLVPSLSLSLFAFAEISLHAASEIIKTAMIYKAEHY